MKTISLRELHNKTGKWVRAVENEKRIVVTDRGEPVASLSVFVADEAEKVDWTHRDLVPGYAALRNSGKLRSVTDSSVGVSAERASRD